MDTDCKRYSVMRYLRDCLVRCYELTLADRLMILHEIKATCPCFERCRRWSNSIIEAADTKGYVT